MNNNEEKKEKKSSFSDAWKKTADFGKKAAVAVQKGAEVVSEQTKKTLKSNRLKKYKPLFLKKFRSKDFKIPNVIQIVDDAVRRGIDVCEGAIGWIDDVSGVEVLYLYDEFAPKSGLSFIPVAKCDAVYCVDNFDRNCFIETSCIFGKANEEKLAELENIAYMLGARRCSVELIEANFGFESKSTNSQSRRADKNNVENDNGESFLDMQRESSAKMERYLKNKNEMKSSSKTFSSFEGNDEPKVPELKWFAHDNSIKSLIEMRCSSRNSIKSKRLELKGSSSATMSQKTACAIDKLLKIGGKTSKSNISMSMEREAIKEHSRKLLFEIEF